MIETAFFIIGVVLGGVLILLVIAWLFSSLMGV